MATSPDAPLREIRGTTRLTAVLGWPVAHSRSPQMLNAAYAAVGLDAVMVPMPVHPDALPAAVAGLRAARALGASVTVPHKLAVAALCDELAPAARRIGAVNCLEIDDDGRITGHNTDEGGYADALAAAGFDLKGRRVVLLGAGGAARAVAYGVRGARAIEVIARRPAEVAWARAWPWEDEHLRAALGRADLLIDCTPVGLEGGDAEAAHVAGLPLDALPAGAWVSTLIYHRETALLAAARDRGHRVLDGAGMLVHQAARAFAIWTGHPAPVAAMGRALHRAIAAEA